MRFCKKCEKTYPDDKKFCSECGGKLTELVEKPVKEAKVLIHRETSIPWTKIILIAVGIGIVILVGTLTGLFSLPGPVPIITTTVRGTTTMPRITTVRTTTLTPTTTTISKFDISVKVVNEYTDEPIEGAVLYLDDSDIGVTGQYGTKIIKDLLVGSYNLRACHPVYRDICTRTPIDVSSFSNFEVKIKAPRDVMLTVKDTETQNLVKDTKVSLEDRNGNIIVTQTTTQEGTVLAKDIIPGEYRIAVHIVEDGTEIKFPSQYKQIGYDSKATLEVNMPNPDLVVSVDTDQNWIHTEFYCDITVTNNGNHVSKNPLGVCILYEIDNIDKTKPPKKVGSDSALFRDIAKNGGSQHERVTIHKSPNPLTDEDVVVVIYDSNPYGPNKNQEIALQTSESFGSRVVSDAYAYCSGQPEKCVKLAGQFVSEIIKAWFTGGAA